MAEALELVGITKSFGDVQAVRGVDVQVPRGSICGFLGPNGAGKTTCIRMIMNIIRPDSGEVHILSEPGVGRILNRVGYLPEERGLYTKMRVRDLLVYFGRLKGMNRRRALDAATRWLGTMDLHKWAGNKVQDLSKGMQQKVQIIACILHDPEVVILDEPFSGMDPINTETVSKIIREMRAAGKTILFSTHVMEQAEKLCDRIVLINRGRVVLSGGLREVQSKFGSNVVRVQVLDPAVLREMKREVAGVRERDDLQLIKLNPDVDPQDFLRALLARTEVTRFQIGAPPLHDIFIHVVESGGSHA